jgi:hypothetical protein
VYGPGNGYAASLVRHAIDTSHTDCVERLAFDNLIFCNVGWLLCGSAGIVRCVGLEADSLVAGQRANDASPVLQPFDETWPSLINPTTTRDGVAFATMLAVDMDATTFVRTVEQSIENTATAGGKRHIAGEFLLPSGWMSWNIHALRLGHASTSGAGIVVVRGTLRADLYPDTHTVTLTCFNVEGEVTGELVLRSSICPPLPPALPSTFTSEDSSADSDSDADASSESGTATTDLADDASSSDESDDALADQAHCETKNTNISECAIVGPDRVAIGTDDGLVTLFNLKTGVELATVDLRSAQLEDAAATADGRVIAFATRDGVDVYRCVLAEVENNTVESTIDPQDPDRHNATAVENGLVLPHMRERLSLERVTSFFTVGVVMCLDLSPCASFVACAHTMDDTVVQVVALMHGAPALPVWNTVQDADTDTDVAFLAHGYLVVQHNTFVVDNDCLTVLACRSSAAGPQVTVAKHSALAHQLRDCQGDAECIGKGGWASDVLVVGMGSTSVFHVLKINDFDSVDLLHTVYASAPVVRAAVSLDSTVVMVNTGLKTLAIYQEWGPTLHRGPHLAVVAEVPVVPGYKRIILGIAEDNSCYVTTSSEHGRVRSHALFGSEPSARSVSAMLDADPLRTWEGTGTCNVEVEVEVDVQLPHDAGTEALPAPAAEN